MNARRVTMVAVVLSFGSFTLEESALAQEEMGLAQSETSIATHHGRGTRHVAGRRQRLDGSHYPFRAPQRNDTVRLRYGGLPDAGPQRGHLRRGTDPHDETRDCQGPGAESFSTSRPGTWTSIATIDPDSSTGRFAGATGTLWFP